MLPTDIANAPRSVIADKLFRERGSLGSSDVDTLHSLLQSKFARLTDAELAMLPGPAVAIYCDPQSFDSEIVIKPDAPLNMVESQQEGDWAKKQNALKEWALAAGIPAEKFNRYVCYVRELPPAVPTVDSTQVAQPAAVAPADGVTE